MANTNQKWANMPKAFDSPIQKRPKEAKREQTGQKRAKVLKSTLHGRAIWLFFLNKNGLPTCVRLFADSGRPGPARGDWCAKTGHQVFSCSPAQPTSHVLCYLNLPYSTATSSPTPSATLTDSATRTFSLTATTTQTHSPSYSSTQTSTITGGTVRFLYYHS